MENNSTVLYQRTESLKDQDNLLEKVIQNKVPVNQQDKNGNTALHFALSQEANIDTLQHLIINGASLTLKNEEDNTALDCIPQGAWRTALNLMTLEKKLRFTCKDGGTLLHQLLQDDLGKTPLHVAADFWPSPTHLEIMLTHFPELNPFLKDHNGDTFLHIYLALYGITDGTKFFDCLLQGELPSIPKRCLQQLLKCQNKFLETPFIVFIKEKSKKVNKQNLQKLIDAGSDVNLCEVVKNSALHCILLDYIHTEEDANDRSLESLNEEEQTEDENIRCLIKNGSIVNAQNVEGQSPLFMANYSRSINTLLDFGAEVNLSAKFGHTPLMSYMSSSEPSADIIETLIQRGADCNIQDHNGGTLLHYVAWHAIDTEIVHIMQKYHIKVVPDKLGQFPCHLAYHCGHKKVFDELCCCDKSSHTEKEHFNFQEGAIDYSVFDQSTSETVEIVVNRSNIFLQKRTAQILNLPGLGYVNFQDSEAGFVKWVVHELVVTICKKISERHEMLSIKLMESGSVGEDTKVGFPDEFDFVCIFHKLGDLCFVDEQSSSHVPGFTYLKLKEEKYKANIESYMEYFDDERYLRTARIRTKFGNVLEDLFMSREIFSHPNISVLAADTVKAINRPTFKFTLRWVGCVYKDMKIDIDLVPACHIKGWWPNSTNIHLLPTEIHEQVQMEGALLMLQTASSEYMSKPTKQCISTLKVEKALLQTLPDTAKKAYMASKILCNTRVCPSIEETEVKEVITSYMLKNCLFHVLQSSNSLINSNTPVPEQIHTLVVQIFLKLLQFSNEEKLPSFILPWKNVFTSSMVSFHIHDPSTLHFLCSQRCAFVKMILNILGEKEDL